MIIIELGDLAWGLIPVLITLVLMQRWALSTRRPMLAIARMLLQLLLIGYVLSFIFGSDNPLLISGVLSVMLVAASWIALDSLPGRSLPLAGLSLLAIAGGGLFTLVVITQGVMHVQPWYKPSVIIPIAGMIFSNSMNTISLAGERFYSEYERDGDYCSARNTAYQAALIPVTNALMAVGLVSLPGMMTGQILSGVSPLIAARYQIMVMLMIFGSSGISAALFLMMLLRRQLRDAPGTDKAGGRT